jgi:hypothetical protein
MERVKLVSLLLLLSIMVGCGKHGDTSTIQAPPPDDNSESKRAPMLIVGDSHSCGAFGAQLLKDLADDGYFVTLYCAVSSSPTNWIKGTTPSGQVCQTMTSSAPTLKLCDGTGKVPKFSTILASHESDTVIIAHGTNSLLSSSVDSNYGKMAALVSERCVWVGPPHLRPDQAKGFTPDRLKTMEKNLPGFYTSLENSLGSDCGLVDSRSFTTKGSGGGNTSDGVHRTTAAGKYWANQVGGTVLD